ncbi:tail length tape measure protein [Siphoviridae environmental samples]|nr:tail length tape measure protein [Siphoviridae environmental samples]
MANFAQLGIQIDSKQAEDAARDLDDLAAAGARAEKATDKLSKTTTDWAAEQQKANARASEMEHADARRAASAQKANSSIKDQQQELAKLIGQINPAVAALERLDEQERKLAQFRKQNLIDSDTFADYNQRLAQQRVALTQVSGAANQAGMSQRAYSAAMRNVPAQITDITTSLIGGQPAYLVAIQQGGQLKDMFGGIVPAARALATSLVSMINPWTLLAAAIGVAAYASYDAAKSIERLSIAAAKGDGLAGTAQKLGDLAASLNALDGISIGNAEDAIARLAAGGKLTGQNLDLAAEASARWASVTGESIDSVASKFEAIGKDPLQAIESGQIRVTEAQYKQVKALVDTGDQQSAVNELTRIYFDSVNSNSAIVESNLTNISRTWRDIKDSTGEAFREAGKFFDFFVGASRQAASNNSWWQNLIPAANLYSQFSAMRNLQPNQPIAPPASSGPLYDPDADKRQKERAKALAEWSATADKAASRQNTLNQLEQRGIDLGQSRAEINRVLNQQRAEWARQDEKKAASAAKAAMADDNSARRMLDNALRQISANNEVAESGEKVTASRRLEIQIEQLLEKEKNKMTAATRAELQAAKESLATTDAQAKARQQLTRDTAAGAAMEERLAQIYKQQQEQNEVSLMSIGRGSQASELLQRQLNLRRDYLSAVEKLDRAQRNKNTALSEEEYSREKALLEKSLADRLSLEQAFQQERQAAMGDWRNGANAAFEEFLANSRNVAGQYQSLFTSAFDGATDAFTRFVTTGKASFKEFTASILSDLAKIYARQALVGLIGSIGQKFGPKITGFASGGYTGDGGKYDPRGIVHAGEVVWSQADVKAVGGPRRANAMRPTAGYANGGIVGGGASAANYNSVPNVEININMEGGSVSSQGQNGAASQNVVDLVNMIKGVVGQWYNEQSKTGGVVYRQQRGMG